MWCVVAVMVEEEEEGGEEEEEKEEQYWMDHLNVPGPVPHIPSNDLSKPYISPLFHPHWASRPGQLGAPSFLVLCAR